MSAVLDSPPQATAEEFTPPRPANAIGSATLRAWAALQPASDAEAGAVAPPNLLLTEVERQHLQGLAKGLEEARAALTQADAASARVEALARTLDSLRMRQGEMAARAFSGDSADKAQLDTLMESIVSAQAAELARPAMRERALTAREHANRCFGALRHATRKALEQARCRQALEYERLAAELRRVVAHLGATVDLLGGDNTAWHAHYLPDLSLPALPLGVRMSHAGVEQMFQRDMLVKVQHSVLTHCTTAAAGHLRQQVEQAAQMPADRLL